MRTEGTGTGTQENQTIQQYSTGGTQVFTHDTQGYGAVLAGTPLRFYVSVEIFLVK